MKATVKLMLSFLFIAVPFLGKGAEIPEIKIKAEVTKSGYVGEVFVYEIKLMSTKAEIANVRAIKNPSFPKNAKVIQGTVGSNRAERVKEKGKEYFSWTISRYFIIPEESGKMHVGEGKFVAFIPYEKVVYHNFWGARTTIDYEEAVADCSGVDFKVDRLPQNKSSEKFSGCIGDFKIEGWFPPGKISAGKDAYAVFTISGFGSLSDVRLPNIYKIFADGCHLKEIEQSDQQSQRDGRLYSEVTLTCKFMPDEEEFEILPLEIEFFNPETKKYYISKSETLHWTSHPSEPKKSHSRDAIEI